MSSYHQFIVLDAIPEAAWSVISKNAEQHGMILAARRPHVLVAQTDTICYVYAFSVVNGPVKKTRLDLAVTHDAAAAAALVDAADLIGAMNDLPGDMTAQDMELAQAHLLTLKQLMSPIPTAVAAKKAHEMNQSDAVPLYGVPVVTLAKVWFFFIFLGGIFSATLLLALNWWNMGYKRKALSTIGAVAIVWTTCIGVIMVVLARSSASIDYTWYPILGFVPGMFVSASVVFWQARLQSPLYQASVAQYGKPSVWVIRNVVLAAGAIALGVAIGVAWPRVIHKVVSTGNALLMPLTPRTTYTDQHISIQYPSHWSVTHFYSCEDGQECLLEVTDPISGGAVSAFRNLDYFNVSLSLKELDELIWNDMTQDLRDLDDHGQLEFKIDGRVALLHTYSSVYDTIWGYQFLETRMTTNVLYIQDGDALIFLNITMPIDQVSTANSIIDSVHFVTPFDQ